MILDNIRTSTPKQIQELHEYIRGIVNDVPFDNLRVFRGPTPETRKIQFLLNGIENDTVYIMVKGVKCRVYEGSCFDKKIVAREEDIDKL